MPEKVLRDCRILVVEDEYFIAEDLRYELTEAGAIVVGMASTVKEALEIIDSQGNLDAAILDVNLGGKPAFPVADRLLVHSVPFVFTTGYEASAIPSRFQEILRCEKPFSVSAVLRSLKQVIGA